MAKCGAQWQVYAAFSGVVRQYQWTITVAVCSLPRGHAGNHLAKTISPVNREVAEIQW